MSNYNIRIDLQKLKGAFITKLQGKNAEKICICIPIDEGEIYKGEKGCYLSLTAMEMREEKFGDTHFVKVQYSKEDYTRLTEEQKNNIPIIGGLKPARFGTSNNIEKQEQEKPSFTISSKGVEHHNNYSEMTYLPF